MSDPTPRVRAPLVRHLTLWAWLPIALYLAPTAATVYLNGNNSVFEPAWMLPVLNIIFCSGIGGAVAYLAGSSYIRGGTLPPLALGGGMLAIGLGFALAGLLGTTYTPAAVVSMHDLAMLLAGACLLAAAISTLFPMFLPLPGTRRQHVLAADLAIFVILGLLFVLIVANRLPALFIQGEGPTPLRQFILALATLEFAAAGILFWQAYVVSRFYFFHWYAVGLLLFTVGLAVLLREQTVGGLVNWAGRWGEYLGGLYILGGLVTTAREARERGLPREQVFAVALLQAALPYRPLVETTSEAVAALDPHGAILYWNEAARQQFGYDAAEVFGADLLQRIVPAARLQETRAAVGRLPRTAEGRFTGERLEVVLESRDGRQFPAEIAFYTNPAAPGHLTVCLIRDITERREAEANLRRLNQELEGRVEQRTAALAEANQALRKSEARYRRLLDLAPDAVLVHQDGRIVYANAAAVRLYGAASFEALRGRDVLELVHPDERELARARAQQVQEGGVAPLHTFRHRRLDGQEVPVETLAAAVDWQGKPAVQAVIRDITERKRVEERLAEQQHLLHTIVEQAADGIVVRDAQGRLIFASAVALQRARMPEAGSPLAEAPAVFGEVFDAAGNRLPVETWPISRALRGETVRGAEWHRVAPDGTRLVLLNSAAPLRDRTGTIIGAVAITTDITERKRAEEALQQAHADLEQKIQERTAELSQTVVALLDEMARRKEAESALRDRSEQLQLLATELTWAEQRERRRLAQVLHDDLQQLLVGARLKVDKLQRLPDETVRRTADDVEGLILQALDISRSLTAELSPPALYEGDLVPALEWLVAWMRDKHGLQVDLATTGDVPPVAEATRVMLFHAVRELLFNVVKHAQVSAAALQVGRQGERIQIVVRDGGVGFDPARLVIERGRSGGFGLFSIRERLELLGGRLEIDSAPGKGSRFTVWLPIRDAMAESGAAAPLVEPATGAARTAGAGPAGGGERKVRVLVVEDHLVVRQGLVRLLEEAPDIEVVGEAADGQTAVALARELLPHVVTMDIEMPGMDGIEATRRIHGECPGIRVIGLSMHEAAAPAMREAGAINFLPKSAPSDTLVAAIRACSPSPGPG